MQNDKTINDIPWTNRTQGSTRTRSLVFLNNYADNKNVNVVYWIYVNHLAVIIFFVSLPSKLERQKKVLVLYFNLVPCFSCGK